MKLFDTFISSKQQILFKLNLQVDENTFNFKQNEVVQKILADTRVKLITCSVEYYLRFFVNQTALFEPDVFENTLGLSKFAHFLNLTQLKVGISA